MNDDELTPSEKEALESLPKERMPSALLEERVVDALRSRGVLQPQNRRIVEMTAFRIAAAIAASILLLVGGFALGRWAAYRQSVQMDTTTFARDEASIAAQLQQAGTTYILALEHVASLPDSIGGDEKRQGREVALNTFYSAAGHVSKLVPRDYLAGKQSQTIETSGEGAAKGDAGKTKPLVIWF